MQTMSHMRLPNARGPRAHQTAAWPVASNAPARALWGDQDIYDQQTGLFVPTHKQFFSVRRGPLSPIGDPTARALAAKASRAGLAGPMWQQRLEAYQEHVYQLGRLQVLALGLRQVYDLLHLPRRFAAMALFPGLCGLPQPLNVGAENGQGLAQRPQCIITRDHAVLEGLRICPPNLRHDRQPILVVGGNAMRVQDRATAKWLSALATATSRQVFMFNFRNFGDSLGSLCSSDAAINDAVAMIERACAPRGGCSVVGISIGGGCAAAALAELYAQGKLAFGAVDAFLAVHSFRSLAAAAAGLFGPFIGFIVRVLLWLCGFSPLNTEATLRRTRLAPQVFSLHAECDQLVVPAAALRVAELAGVAPAHAAGTTSRDIFAAGYAHCDLSDVAAWCQRIEVAA